MNTPDGQQPNLNGNDNPTTVETRNNNSSSKASPRPSPSSVPANKVVPFVEDLHLHYDCEGAHNLDVDVDIEAAGTREKAASHKVDKDHLQLKPAAGAAVPPSSSG